MSNISVIVGDITKQKVDAIINAANRWMLGGGGVDGAIHRAAGPTLVAECRKYPADANGYRVQIGDAKITGAGNLPCKHVIHTAGPDCREVRDHAEQDRLLASSYRRSLEVAKANGLKSVASPSISTGIFGFPMKRAVTIVAKTVTDFLSENPGMSFTMCVYSPDPAQAELDQKAYEDAFASYKPGTVIPNRTLSLSDDDCKFLEDASLNLAFIMQRINRQLDTGNSPKPGVQALAGFRAIDYARLTSLSDDDESGRVKGMVAIYNEVVLSEKNGWTSRVLPQYWVGDLYDKEDPKPATSYSKWAFERKRVMATNSCENPGLATSFPVNLTKEMLLSFTEVLAGSTRPHKGTIGGVDYVLKCGSYSPTSSAEHVHNEYVADCFLRAAGCNVPESREYKVDVSGRGAETVRLSRFLKGARLLGVASSVTDAAIRRQIVETYPVMSFIAAIDTYQHSPMDNVLVDSEGNLWFVDNGASFDFCAKGARKNWFFTRSDIHDPGVGYFSLLRHRDQGNLRTLLAGVSDEELRKAAARYCFVDLVAALPADYQHPNLISYAKQLDSWVR